MLYVVAIISLAHAAYISRMSNVNRVRVPAVFRPGVMLQRPWTHQRIAASHRVPYVVYRGPVPHRYAMKPYNPNFRNVLPGGPWKTGRVPAPSTTEFMRAASASPILPSHGGTGAIHTIPAPDLSLAEKPIVVAETSVGGFNSETSSETTKATYEVTEKYSEPSGYQAPAKIESPTGFSKQSPLTTPEMHQFVHNGAAYQLPSQYGASSLIAPQNPISPQQFSMQGFTELTGHQDLLQTAAEGIVIPPSALYQNDPNFLQKLQSQLLQQFPSVEFIPYATDAQPQTQQTSPQPELFLLENEVLAKQASASFKPSEFHRNIVQRETQEGSLASLVPHAFIPSNVTENYLNTTAPDPQNATSNTAAAKVAPSATAKHEVDTTTEEQKATPIYYAQVGQSVGDVIAKGFYSAINEVRAAASLAQDEKGRADNSSTTTGKPDTELENVNPITDAHNETDSGATKEAKEVNNEIGTEGNAKYKSREDAPNVAYTLLRSPEDNRRVNKEGDVYAGQLVQAVVSEDRELKKDRPAPWRPPLRLYAAPEKKIDSVPPKMAAVKAKIPPKSKLTFDNKTGEPILRIYASYSENPSQKEMLLSKLTGIKHYKEGVSRKQENMDNRKAATMKTYDKNMSNDQNQMAQFGLKLRSRSDDYIPLFEEYEE